MIQEIARKSYLFFSNEARDLLDHEFNGEEIKWAIFQMGKLKTPSPDGFQVEFFQEYWDVVDEDVIGAVLSFFNHKAPMSSINQTFITLIPKIKYPEGLTDFRPISLYNAFYKIIAKSMVNMLNEVFPKIISPNQSAFVKSRQISDNIIVAHEILRFMKKDKSNSHHMAIKIDMSKAYDREWEMILSMIKNLSFNQRWRN